VIITSPHATTYLDYFHISPGAHGEGNFGQFRARQVKVETDYDEEFVRELSSYCEEIGIPAGTQGERNPELDHATMIPLYFLQHYTKDFKTVRIGISGLTALQHYQFGQAIQKTVERLGRKAVFIASGDLSHKLKEDGPYGYAKEGPEFDQKITEAFAKGDFLQFLTFAPSFCDKAAECGLRSFMIMAGALDRTKVSSCLYSYEGPFGVGYGVAEFVPEGEDSTRNIGEQYEAMTIAKVKEQQAKEDPYVHLARETITRFITHQAPVTDLSSYPVEMRQKKAGVFVSLHEEGELRGCIGTFKPTTECIAKEIQQNAVSACSEDPRFPSVEEEELEKLVISVDVLGEVEPVKDSRELDVHRYGVIVSCGRRRGLLLPDLEGVDTVAEQIAIARRKGGIREEEPITLERFEVVRHQ
jgi:AmmeMemoRadiSam system protein A